MYSAKKQAGRKLYELARRGEEVERPPVRVCIYEFEAINLPVEPTRGVDQRQSMTAHSILKCALFVRPELISERWLKILESA